MNFKIVDALIKEGYSGLDVHRFENCKHDFQTMVIGRIINSKVERRVSIVCTNCGCDHHAANLMGLDPMYYRSPEKLI